MTPAELRNELAGFGVTPPDDSLRCCLYLQRIRDARDFFHTDLNQSVALGGLGPGYNFVGVALRDPELLNEFCMTLDYFLAPAVLKDVQVNGGGFPTFEAYYTQAFLNANFNVHVNNFFQAYPVTAAILDRVAQNFRNNIKEACERILNDRLAIISSFLPLRSNLTGLTKFKSSGSDFHKGGKQVLLLTFSVQTAVRAGADAEIAQSSLRLVYKPSDLEADCLIAGNSAVVNQHDNTFNCISLFEVLNTAINNAKALNPALWLEPLPTYKILPMAYTSNQAAGLPVNVRRTYGYIEFLQHEYEPGLGAWGYYPWGVSDYQIFKDEATICERFYKIIGQISAIAATFSLSDLHSENVIVKEYTPYPIDMEISLTIPIINIGNTVLFGDANHGGVVGDKAPPKAFYRELPDVHPLEIRRAYVPDEENPPQNRLFSVAYAQLIRPQDYATQICKSLRDMLEVIGTTYAAGLLAPWIARVANVLVRSIPFTTSDLKNLVSRVVGPEHCADINYLPIDIRQQRTLAYEAWNGAQTNDPAFLAMQTNVVLGDFQNADIPIFYTRIGETNIVNSNGVVVPSPGIVNHYDNANNEVNTPYVLPPPPPNRNSYYPASPFTNFVVNTQLHDLTVPLSAGARITHLVGNILNDFGMANAATDINQILA